ncbi:MAG: aminotransferase class V-fold PLP-dependent enzyme [Actinomycetota bacterium]
MPIDVAAARAATPGCHDLVHFNNAGSALPTETVLRTQIEYLELEARTGGYEAHAQEQARIDEIRPTIARLVRADPSGDEIALAVNNTAAFDLFLYSWAVSPGHTPEPGDRILTTESEYGANVVGYLQIAQRTGAVVEVVPSNEHGEIDLDALDATIRRTDAGPVKLIAINHIPTNGGLINPAAEVGAIAREHGITYLLDTCQSVGQLPIDVDKLGCDALTATGRKFLRGPRGTGFLYVRSSILPTLDPIVLDHSAADWVAPDRYDVLPTAGRFEQWERNYASLLGLGQAVQEALDLGLDDIADRVQSLAASLRGRLTEDVPDAVVHDLGREQCGIVTFSLGDQNPAEVKARLQAEHINVSVVPPASALIDSTKRQLPPLMRASVHYYNDDTEIDRLVDALHRPS